MITFLQCISYSEFILEWCLNYFEQLLHIKNFKPAQKKLIDFKVSNFHVKATKSATRVLFVKFGLEMHKITLHLESVMRNYLKVAVCQNIRHKLYFCCYV